MRQTHRIVRALAPSLLVLLLPLRAAPAQGNPPGELLDRGISAYNRLPSRVTLRDAKLFSEAVGYLFAYEQRTYRDKVPLDSRAVAALGWLLPRLKSFEIGKGDEPQRFRDDDELREKGLTLYKLVERSEIQGRIWEVSGFISASANLFAYLQCASDPDDDARRAYGWLVEAGNRLTRAGGTGDDPNDPASWLPGARKPGTKPAVVNARTVVVGPPSGIRRADRAVGRGAASAVRPGGTGDVPRVGSKEAEEPKSAGNPSPAASDSIGVLYKQAAAERDSIRADYERLQAANQDLREKLNQLQREAKPGLGKRNMALAKAERYYTVGQFREARELAATALRLDPSSGAAHLLLARIYGGAATAGGSRPEDRAIFWLAMDHLQWALKTGVADDAAARRLLLEYSARAPTDADIDEKGWVRGQRLRIDFEPYAWIGEETTIRSQRPDE